MMTILALVVLVQSGIILWSILDPGGRDGLLSTLRRTPVLGEVVEVCLPATPIGDGRSPPAL